VVTRGNSLLKFEFGAKTVAHAYTLIKLIRFQFENEVVYMLALFLNLRSIEKSAFVMDCVLFILHYRHIFRIEGKLASNRRQACEGMLDACKVWILT
jgi:hypothetical protein